MTKEQLQKLIAEEVRQQLKSIIPSMVKPLVQEAVAGALARLLAEGVVAGPPKTTAVPSRSTTPVQTRTPVQSKRSLSESDKRALVTKMGYGTVEPIGTTSLPPGLPSILAETALEMQNGTDADSVLDAVDAIQSPEVVDAITRDYSALMDRMKSRGQLRG